METNLSLQFVKGVDEDMICNLEPLALLQQEVKIGGGGGAVVLLREERGAIARFQLQSLGQARQLRQDLVHRQLHVASPRVVVHHVHRAGLREEGRARRAVLPRHAGHPQQERVVHHHAHGPAVGRLGAEELVQRARPGGLEPCQVLMHVADLVVAAKVAAIGDGDDGDRSGSRRHAGTKGGAGHR